jgi:ATP-dependent helicase HrpB
VVTEGILTRRLTADPTLAGVAMIIFDEFHERSLQADLNLALCLDVQRNLREDLKILVMSATLDCGPLAALLGKAPVIHTEGRLFPVEERYAIRGSDRPLAEQVAGAVTTALRETDGDVLVFLPGAGEIWRPAEELQTLDGGRGIEPTIHPLYGDLPFEEQESAIVPSKKRKVVLATNIAETSLTIEGVRVVIDSGLARRMRYDPRTGMNRLFTVTISRASAEQRKGRAGRLGPGVCYRLYDPHVFQSMAPYTPPEMLTLDQASLVLQLAAWGVKDPGALSWIDPPPVTGWEEAGRLLADLGALDPRGAITRTGREMVRLPLHPRLSHLLTRSFALGCPRLGADLAALLSERDVLRPQDPRAGRPTGKDEGRIAGH